MLAQVITPHRAVITIVEGNVAGAVMDEVWDMALQMMIATDDESLKA